MAVLVGPLYLILPFFINSPNDECDVCLVVELVPFGPVIFINKYQNFVMCGRLQSYKFVAINICQSFMFVSHLNIN